MAIGLVLASAQAPVASPSPCRRSHSGLISRRLLITLNAAASVAFPWPAAAAESAPSTSNAVKQAAPLLPGIANTKTWPRVFGDGFCIRVPPLFEDIGEPEVFNAEVTYYGDKAKPKPFAARFASPDRSEVLSVVIRPTNQLKITFLEAKDITDLGSLKQAAKIFVPGGANLYSARTIKIKEDDDILRTYYFYEFSFDMQRIALVATVTSGKAYIAGATAPEPRWEDDGVKLRSAALSLSLV